MERKNALVTGKQRDAGLELLGIFAMMLIILSNLAVHGGFVFERASFNSVLISVLAMGENIGINIFILIAGYHSIRTRPTLRRAIVLIAQTVFYSVALYYLSCALGVNSIRKKYVVYSLAPFFSNKGYWFVTIYLLLYMMIPFVNAGLWHLKRRQYLCVLGVLFFLWSVLPRTYGAFFGIPGYGLSELGWFMLVYSAGAYLRLYPVKTLRRRRLTFPLWLITAAIMIGAKALLETGLSVTGRKGMLIGAALGFITDTSLFGPMAFLFAFLSFAVFRQVKVKPLKIIYLVSASTFGVYLIHDSAWFRSFVWERMFNISGFAGAPYFIALVFAVMLAVFASCAAIDILRKRFIETPLFRSKIYKAADKKIKDNFDKAMRRFDRSR